MSDVAAAILLLRPYLLVAAVALLIIASLGDIASRTIPDLAPVGLLVIGAALRLADYSVASAFVASMAILAAGALCWRFGWLGGGDVKLLAASAWLVAPTLVPRLILLTALLGGALACLYLILGWLARAQPARSRMQRRLSLGLRILRAEWWRIRRRASLPYGCAITGATLLVLIGR
jgi:prepilin peptidase CpaA